MSRAVARITFAAYGTWGDVGPFIVLADVLASRGHNVTFLLPEGLHAIAHDKRFKLGALPIDYTPDRLFETRDALQARRTRRKASFGLQLPHLRQCYAVLELAAGDTDVFIVHPAIGALARMVNEKRGTPYVVGCLAPIVVPTSENAPAHWPFPPLPGPLGRALNRLLWRVVETRHAHSRLDRVSNELRASIGLPSIRANRMHAMSSASLVLVLMSRHFFPVPKDWPEHYRTPGFLVRGGPSDAPASADVERFLEEHEQPVLVTFAHLGALLHPELFEVIAEILDDLGIPTILNVGYKENVTPALQNRAGVYPSVPISSVLPSCRAVVHIGGLGTLGAILTAGKPSLVLPITPESRWSAQRLDALGVGIGIKRKPARRGSLRRALIRLLADESYAKRAERLAESIRDDDAEAQAADEVERLIDHVT